MKVLAIDPGTTHSAFVVLNEDESLGAKGKVPNEDLLGVVQSFAAEHLAIERFQARGMPMGEESIETVLWTGRFVEAWVRYGKPFSYVRRSEVKSHLCGSQRAKDPNVRQAILDRYPRTGGGQTPQVGTKKQPGPLRGVTADVWAALGVALTWKDTRSDG